MLYWRVNLLYEDIATLLIFYKISSGSEGELISLSIRLHLRFTLLNINANYRSFLLCLNIKVREDFTTIFMSIFKLLKSQSMCFHISGLLIQFPVESMQTSHSLNICFIYGLYTIDISIGMLSNA